jgi:hypothetical protein
VCYVSSLDDEVGVSHGSLISKSSLVRVALLVSG